jgi:hypothetical protein
MEPNPVLPGVACAPRLDCAVPIHPIATDPVPGIPPHLAGFDRTSADETAILSILRVLHQSDEPRSLSGVEQAFVIAGRTLFAELAAVCDRMLERAKAMHATPLSPPPKRRSGAGKHSPKEPPAQ